MPALSHSRVLPPEVVRPKTAVADDRQAFTRRAFRVWVWLLVATFAVAVFFAAATGFAGAPGDGWLGVSFGLQPARLGDAAGIWLRNLLVLSPGLLGPMLVGWFGRGRWLLLALIWLKAVLGALSVGLVAGAYGLPTIPWLLHVPVEWAAVAVAITRLGRVPVAAGSGPLAVALLAVAALLEIFATPHS